MRTTGIPVPPALVGFVLLVLALAAVSYAVGRVAGPVAPGLHRVEEPGRSGPGEMDDMPGMDHGMRSTQGIRVVVR
ncbi:hypothetical protein AB0M39_33035 [Streptomyces sp. NPDC051907]|uniref:hypothetical protein n=1 Tax=Streptomyces sp. NPDC051907 TaxID=3155284 RepID=UPI0034199C73